MNLNIEEWKEFEVAKLFSIKNGKGITKEEIEDNSGDFTVVQSGSENNGVIGKIDIDYCKSMDYTISEVACLTVARTGTAGYVSFHENGCVVGDSAKILLLDNDVASKEVYLFLQSFLNFFKYKYDFGRKVTEEKYGNEVIVLPIKCSKEGVPYLDNSYRFSSEGYIPDWKWMEKYISSLKYKPISTKNKRGNNESLEIEKWKEFKIRKLFRIEPTKGKTSDELIEGTDIAYIGAKHSMNGWKMTCQKEGFEDWISKGNCVVFVQLGAGSAGYANYMEDDFIGMNGKTCCGYIDGKMNKYIGIFLATVLSAERPKYSFGRSWTGDRLLNTIIKLPVQHNANGSIVYDKTKEYSEDGYVPDWVYMENYIKLLPYGDRL